MLDLHLLMMMTTTKQSLHSCLSGRGLPRPSKLEAVAATAAASTLTPAPHYEGTLVTLLPTPQGDYRMSPALTRARAREKRGSAYFKSHPILIRRRIRPPLCLSRHPVAADILRGRYHHAERPN